MTSGAPAGLTGPNRQLSDLIDIACIFSASSFNDSKQDVADVLTQQGSALTPVQALVVVTVALKYPVPSTPGSWAVKPNWTATGSSPSPWFPNPAAT